MYNMALVVRRASSKALTRRPRKTFRRYRKKRPMSASSLALKLFEHKKNEYREVETGINTLTGWYANGSSMQLTQGGAYNQLTGHLVRGRGIAISGWVKSNATTTVLLRMGVAKILRGSSKTTDFFAGTDVLETNTANQNITTANSGQRLTGRFNQDQYRIVKQRIIKLGTNSTSDGSDVRQYKFWIPLKGRKIRYDGSGVFPTENVYAFFMVPCLGNNDESLGETVEFTFTSTFYYVDV